MKKLLLVLAIVLGNLCILVSTANDDAGGYLEQIIEHSKRSAAATMRNAIIEVLNTINFAKFKEYAIRELKTMPEGQYRTEYQDWYQRVISKTPILTTKYKFNANTSRTNSISFISSLTIPVCQQILDDVPDEVLLKEGLYTLSLLKSFGKNSQ